MCCTHTHQFKMMMGGSSGSRPINYYVQHKSKKKTLSQRFLFSFVRSFVPFSSSSIQREEASHGAHKKSTHTHTQNMIIYKNKPEPFSLSMCRSLSLSLTVMSIVSLFLAHGMNIFFFFCILAPTKKKKKKKKKQGGASNKIERKKYGYKKGQKEK